MADSILYTVGDSGEFYAEFRNTAGAYMDPDTVTLKLRSPSGSITPYVYGVSSYVVREGVGKYEAAIELTSEGVWQWRWEGAGSARGALEGSITVVPSSFN